MGRGVTWVNENDTYDKLYSYHCAVKKAGVNGGLAIGHIFVADCSNSSSDYV